MPKHDSPHLVISQKLPTFYVISSMDKTKELIAICHALTLTPFRNMDISFVVPFRKRRGPSKVTLAQHVIPENLLTFYTSSNTDTLAQSTKQSST
ncbi:hypothetical protein NPIL_87091 [Nephila pilipes]|uniref:Uncharacterized protein n=1 Tax=Nephila pilipes TaxID=299642 RepID=A0A8X6N8A2_NEPPI|nr:hypothetical protein NPIL_87091 [Nephila pilipes]